MSRKSTRRRKNSFCSFDLLETRQLFSGPPESLIDKIQPRLWNAVEALARGTGEENYDVRNGNVKTNEKGEMQVYLTSAGSIEEMDRSLQMLNVSLEMYVPDGNLAQAWIDPALVDDVAGLPAVQYVDFPIYGVSNTVTSAGDGVLLADKVRSQFAAQGIDGTGIKIGVISDGVNHKANVGAELPAVTVNPSLPGNGDEGTAMLEIVHDLAPGAQLYFSGPTTSVSMVNSINWLVGQGCNVIVDDISFLDQHFFADDTVANAAVSAISNGVVYVSAAGNFSSESHWQGTFLAGASATVDGRYHKFAPDDANNLTITNGSRVRAFLQWADAKGTSGNNYDLHLYDVNNSTFLDTSTTVQNGNDNPFEWVDYTNNSGSTITAAIYIEKKNTAAIREMELYVLGTQSLEFETQSDAIFGQQAANGVMAVAAVPASSPGNVETFSSRGPTTIYSNFTTQTKITRDVLDGTATDGVQTAVGQAGFFYNPFYGTSAAAPHAAAIAALVRQANPSLTPAQVLQYMADTATDISTPGYDQNSGAGRYNALDAVYKAFTPAATDLTAATDTGVSNTDNITKNANPTFTGTAPAGSYVRLLIDNTERAAVQLGAGVTTYNLAVGGAALSNGAHNVQIRVASSSSVALANNSGLSSSLPITVDTTAPSFNAISYNLNSNPMNVSLAFNESILNSVTPGSFTLTNTDASSTIPAGNMAVSYNGGGNIAFLSFPGYLYGALPDAHYSVSIPGANITDIAGNSPAGTFATTFQFLNGDFDANEKVDTLDFNLLAGNFGAAGSKIFQQGDANYDFTVNSLDFNVFTAQYGKKLPSPAPLPASEPLMSAAGAVFSSLPVSGVQESFDEDESDRLV